MTVCQTQVSLPQSGLGRRKEKKKISPGKGGNVTQSACDRPWSFWRSAIPRSVSWSPARPPAARPGVEWRAQSWGARSVRVFPRANPSSLFYFSSTWGAIGKILGADLLISSYPTPAPLPKCVSSSVRGPTPAAPSPRVRNGARWSLAGGVSCRAQARHRRF